MKKIFTLSMTLATGLVAMAVAPEVELGENSVSQETAKVVVTPKPVAEKAIKKATLLKEALPVSGAPMQLPEANALNMYYTNPQGSYSGAIWIRKPDGNSSYFYGGIMTAPYASNTYLNKSAYVEAGKYQNVVDGDFDFEWENYTCDVANGAYVPEQAFNLTFNSLPNEYAGYAYYPPKMMLGDITYEKPFFWNDEEDQALWQCGGVLVTEEDLESLQAKFPTYSDFHYVAHPFNIGDPRYSGAYWTGTFACGTTKESGKTMTQSSIEAFEDLNELSGVTDITNIVGFFQDVKVVAPMAVSAMYLNVFNTNLAGAKLKVELYYLENGEQGEMFNSQEFEFPSSTKRSMTELSMPFKSQDASGFFLDYMLIEKDFRVVITGVEDTKFREIICPLVGMDCYGNGQWPGSWAHAYRPSTYNEFNLGAIVNGVKDGVEGTYAVRSTYYNGSSEDDGTSIAHDPVSLYLGFDLEYPYLQADAAAFNGNPTLEGIELTNEYTVNIKNENEDAVFRVNCPGALEDILVETVDGEDLPEWLYWDINKTTIAKPDKYKDVEANYFALIFALTDGAQPGGCEVKVSYKGVSNIFKINPDLSGIEGVVDNGVETVASEYYDLQGRKLYNEPVNGLFIRKDIKADGSVKSVKVVK